MKKIITAAMICILLSFSVTGFTKEQPETITVIYLKDGQVIKCDMGWQDGDTFYYRKYGGTLGLPLKRIDLGKTFKKSVEEEEEWKAKEIERKAILHTNDRGEDIIYLKDAKVFTDGSMRFGDIDVSLDISRPYKGYRGSSFAVYKITYTITNHGPDANIKLCIAPFTSHGRMVYPGTSNKPTETKYRYAKKENDVIKWIKISARFSQCEIIDKWRVTKVFIRYKK